MSEKKARSYYNKKRFIVPIILLLLLIPFRVYLPTLVKIHLNNTLADIPDYYGEVEDVDIALFRGAYVIKNMRLSKGTSKSHSPFLNFPNTEVSIEWKTLFKVYFVSDILLTEPEVVYIFDDQAEELPVNKTDWSKIPKDFIAIDINRLDIKNGKISFIQRSNPSEVIFQLSQIQLHTDNLNNIIEKTRLLNSPIRASAISTGNGKVSLEGYMNMTKRIPDMDLYFTIENADATALKNFTSYSSGLTFEKGSFDIKSEIDITNGQLKGYIKPIITNYKLIGSEENFRDNLAEEYTSFFKFALKNQELEIVEKKVSFEGDLKNIENNVFTTFKNLFKNAWIKTFTAEVDTKNANKNRKPTAEEKRELRKKEREDERAKRKKERQIKNG